MDGLRINFAETITTGNQVSTKGSEFQDLLTKIKAVNDELKGYWEGTDASKYSSAVEQQAQVMQDLATTIDDIGTFLVQVGNAYQTASEDNANAINL